MKKDIIINSSIAETRIAILEDNKLVELFAERPENERMVGDIYFGRVAKVVPGMQAAFVNIGMKQDAFLHFSDVGDTVREYSSTIDVGDRPKRPRKRVERREPLLKTNQEILVQITKEPIANKGARITAELSLPGRFLVLVPDDSMIGVSRKISDRKEKRKLKNLARQIRPKGFGLIIRTVAEGKTEVELKSDLEALRKEWNIIQKKVKKETPPVLIHKDMGMASSVIRDLFTSDINSLMVDSKKLHREIVKYLKDVAPPLLQRVELYSDKVPIFDKFKIETEINKSLSRKVWLKSGGYVFFDHTEALVAIDVNSGRFISRRDHERSSLKINLEAAHEIARQLRLRDLGGIIVIDFIDMIEDESKKRLHDEFKRELRKDRAQVNITQLSEFGIIEMTRERVRPSLLFALSEPCPACKGTGRIISKTSIVTQIERWIKNYRSISKDRNLELHVNPEFVGFLTKGYKSRIRRIMWKFWMRIKVVADDSVGMDEFKFYRKGEDKELYVES